MDTNQLQTALSMAIEAEDYDTAAVVRDVLQAAMAAKAASSEPGAKVLDWRALGLPDWLADRAERLGFRYPTGVCGGQHGGSSSSSSGSSSSMCNGVQHGGVLLNICLFIQTSLKGQHMQQQLGTPHTPKASCANPTTGLCPRPTPTTRPASTPSLPPPTTPLQKSSSAPAPWC
jgi:hypothetical protein